MREYDPNVYGYVNGEAVYSRDEWIFKCRGFGAIEDDNELIRFVLSRPFNRSYGRYKTLETIYISSYCLDEPVCSLTNSEIDRLKYLQAKAEEARRDWDESLNWKFLHRIYWADNSVEEVWINGLGEKKTVMTVGAHGDAC